MEEELGREKMVRNELGLDEYRQPVQPSTALLQGLHLAVTRCLRYGRRKHSLCPQMTYKEEPMKRVA